MRKTNPDTKTVLRYCLLQLPGLTLMLVLLWVLHSWTHWPKTILWTIGILWIIKDIIMFPFVWKSFADNQSGYSYNPIGQSARAIGPLSPRGRVKVNGIIWPAELLDAGTSVQAGSLLRVMDMQGLTLKVQPQEAPPVDQAWKPKGS